MQPPVEIGVLRNAQGERINARGETIAQALERLNREKEELSTALTSFDVEPTQDELLRAFFDAKRAAGELIGVEPSRAGQNAFNKTPIKLRTITAEARQDRPVDVLTIALVGLGVVTVVVFVAAISKR